MTLIQRIRSKHIHLMQTTLATLGNLLEGLPQEVASTLRDPDDGEKGWTVLEVLCHLRDFDGFFRHRAEMILTQDQPELPAYDHEALAFERNYNAQDLLQVYAELKESRLRFVDFFRNLPEAAWERAGIHPEQGHFTLTDALVQVGHHDNTHIEQITRILTQLRP